MKVPALAAAVLLVTAEAHAQGAVRGCVAERGGDWLSGVTISVKGPGVQRTVTTGADGCYEVARLPAGRYSITAWLSGFEEVAADGGNLFDPAISIADGTLLSRNFWMAPVIVHATIAVPDLKGMYRDSDVVVRVRIERSARPTRARVTRHTATILELFKLKEPVTPAAATLEFEQEEYLSNDDPVYTAGQDLVLFLNYRNGGLHRSSGAYSAFVLAGGSVRAGLHHAGDQVYDGMNVDEFLAKVRALAR